MRRDAESPDGRAPVYWDTPKRLFAAKGLPTLYRGILRKIYDDEFSLATSGNRPRIPVLKFPK